MRIVSLSFLSLLLLISSCQSEITESPGQQSDTGKLEKIVDEIEKGKRAEEMLENQQTSTKLIPAPVLYPVELQIGSLGKKDVPSRISIKKDSVLILSGSGASRRVIKTSETKFNTLFSLFKEPELKGNKSYSARDTPKGGYMTMKSRYGARKFVNAFGSSPESLGRDTSGLWKFEMIYKYTNGLLK